MEMPWINNLQEMKDLLSQSPGGLKILVGRKNREYALWADDISKQGIDLQRESGINPQFGMFRTNEIVRGKLKLNPIGDYQRRSTAYALNNKIGTGKYDIN